MSVYVDDYRCHYGRMRMSHMMADSLEELHAMADAIGVARRWFQWKASAPHYDVCDSKRQAAIELGAVPIKTGSQEWLNVYRAARQLRQAAVDELEKTR